MSTAMSPSVAVLGATGFAGALAAQLIHRHPRFELAAITSRDEHVRLDELYPRTRVPLRMGPYDPDALVGVDAAIVAYPHGASAPVVAQLRVRGVRVIDLSADFRLRDLATYAAWYGSHGAPELLPGAVYGLPELGYREAIAAADLVACPGCYPTAALLALQPLARAGLIGDLVIDAKSGVSGAGRGATQATHFVSADENVTPYKVGAHRHTPEIEQELAALGADLPISFTPHLVPLDQGELVSCYVTPTRAVTGGEVAELFEAAYAGERWIELSARPPGLRDVRDSNYCRIHHHVEARTGRVLVFGAIDNLWKGTASQALQCLNLMFDHDEGEGLA